MIIRKGKKCTHFDEFYKSLSLCRTHYIINCNFLVFYKILTYSMAIRKEINVLVLVNLINLDRFAGLIVRHSGQLPTNLHR